MTPAVILSAAPALSEVEGKDLMAPATEHLIDGDEMLRFAQHDGERLA